VAGAGAPVLPLGIRGGRLLLPCPLLADGGKNGALRIKTTAAAAAAASPSVEGGGKPGIPRTLQLGAMILVWYLLNIYFNIYNKLVRPQSR
jgi:solute carrier family 35 protein E1